MVSESQNSSGVVLPYEQAAIRGDEMPDGLDYPDQVMFSSLRMLYAPGVVQRHGIPGGLCDRPGLPGQRIQ